MNTNFKLPGAIYHSIDLDRTHVWSNGQWVEVDNRLNTIQIRDFPSFSSCKAWFSLCVKNLQKTY